MTHKSHRYNDSGVCVHCGFRDVQYPGNVGYRTQDPICESKSGVVFISRQYTNDEVGVREFIRYETPYHPAAIVSMRRLLCGPVIRGAWFVKVVDRTLLIYMAGYADGHGNVRSCNEYEEVM